MNLSELSVRRGVTFGMVFLIVLGFGLFSLSRLKLDLYPDITFPAVVVVTSYEGASPRDIETLVTKPIEGGVASVEGAKKVGSESKQGVSVVQVEFDWDDDMEQAETDVRRSLELVKGALPDDADDPLVVAFDPSLQPIVMMSMTGPYPLEELRRIAEDEVQPKLERLDGIASVEIAGGLEREIHVRLDPVKVEAHGLDVGAVVGAVYQENSQVPGGAVDQGQLTFTIQTEGKYRSVAEIGEVVVGTEMGVHGPEPLRLADVASVEDSYHESQRILEIDGEPAVQIIVRKQSGENTVKAADAVTRALPAIVRESGADIEIRPFFNQADEVNLSLSNLSSTALIGVGITFLVLLLFLWSFRSALIVSVAMPLSVVATFALMDQVGMTLNVISMAGLALAIGMLVDNAIVVLENIFRLREEGKGAWEAAIRGASTVGLAVTASTLTTVAVFVPVLFVPGIAGVMFRDMAVTICFSLGVSLLVAMTFVPLAASRFLGAGNRAVRDQHSRWDAFGAVRRWYGRSLDWTLSHRWVVGSVLVAALAGTALLAGAIRTDFMSHPDDSQILMQVKAQPGASLAETYDVMKEVVDRVERIIPAAERKLVSVDVGTGEGFVAIFSEGGNSGQIRVPLVGTSDRTRSKREIEEALRNSVLDVAGATVSIGGEMDSMMGEGDIEIQIRGHDLDTARKLGGDLRTKFLALPEVAEANFSLDEQLPEVRIAFDRPKMAVLGLGAARAGNAVSTMFQGAVAGRYAEGGEEFDILVRYDKTFRENLDEIGKLPVVTAGGRAVPLSSFADVSAALGPVDISRVNQARVTTLTMTLSDTYRDIDGKTLRKNMGKSIAKIAGILEGYSWPDGFTYTIGGSAEDMQTSFRYLGYALLVAIALVFMVMASQFESLRQPFIIMFTVPLAAIGVVLAFVLSRSAMDVSALIGVIMLAGIVVNNGIIMVDAANQLRAQGMGLREAIAKAGRLRLRPVLLTSLTTILAMVPLALEIGEGAEMWSGMARAVIGGLTSATFLTLYVVPTIYTLFTGKREQGTSAAQLDVPNAPIAVQAAHVGGDDERL